MYYYILLCWIQEYSNSLLERGRSTFLFWVGAVCMGGEVNVNMWMVYSVETLRGHSGQKFKTIDKNFLFKSLAFLLNETIKKPLDYVQNAPNILFTVILQKTVTYWYFFCLFWNLMSLISVFFRSLFFLIVSISVHYKNNVVNSPLCLVLENLNMISNGIYFNF